MDHKFMRVALQEAKKAFLNDDVPVGAVIVKDKKIIARAYNKKEKTKDVTNHAEIIALKKASKKIGDWRLNDCIMYVTLAPCLMCVGAIMQSRISKVVYGTWNDNVNYEWIKGKSFKMIGPMLEEDAITLLKDFFKAQR